MKLKTKLLPIVALTGIATVAMPLVTSCSKEPEVPAGLVLIDKPFSITSGELISTGLKSEKIKFVDSIEYTIRIKWSDAAKEGINDVASGYGIVCGELESDKLNGVEGEPTAKIVGGRALTSDDFMTNQVLIFMPKKTIWLTNDDTIEIKFKLKTDEIKTTTGSVWMSKMTP